jgi:hypothetical protein
MHEPGWLDALKKPQDNSMPFGEKLSEAMKTFQTFEQLIPEIPNKSAANVAPPMRARSSAGGGLPLSAADVGAQDAACAAAAAAAAAYCRNLFKDVGSQMISAAAIAILLLLCRQADGSGAVDPSNPGWYIIPGLSPVLPVAPPSDPPPDASATDTTDGGAESDSADGGDGGDDHFEKDPIMMDWSI